MLEQKFDHIEECRAHNKSTGAAANLLKQLHELASQFKLARDAERHPAVRQVCEETHDELVALLAVIRPALYGPLNAEAAALREKHKHDAREGK